MSNDLEQKEAYSTTPITILSHEHCSVVDK